MLIRSIINVYYQSFEGNYSCKLLKCPFYNLHRERQEGDRETRGWRRVWIPHSWLQTRGGFRDRAGHPRGEFRSRGWRHHHVGEWQKRHGRHSLGGRKARALRHGRPGAGSGEDL